MRKRKIKFALELKDGQEARSMEELREYFDLRKMIGYLHDGRLVEWLEDRFYQDEAGKIKTLDVNDAEVGKKLCEILGAEYVDTEDAETIVWRKERMERLKQYTADPMILGHVDWVAFDQDDLEDIMREEDAPSTIYLCQNTFSFPSGICRKEKMRYIGIGKNVIVIIKNKEPVDFNALQIVFENIEVQGEYAASGGGEKGVVNEHISLSVFTWFLFEEERKIMNKFSFLDFAAPFLSGISSEVCKCGFLFDNSLDRISANLLFPKGKIIDESEQVVCGWIVRFDFFKFGLFFTDCAVIYTYKVTEKINYKEIKKVWSKDTHVYVETDCKYDFPMILGGENCASKVALLLKYASNPNASDIMDGMFLSIMMKCMGRMGVVNLNPIV